MQEKMQGSLDPKHLSKLMILKLNDRVGVRLPTHVQFLGLGRQSFVIMNLVDLAEINE
jgi:hypothetical protein